MRSLLVILIPYLALANAVQYDVIARGKQRNLKAPSANPELISFDGDLDYILEQALLKAGETFSPQLSDSPSLSPSSLLDTTQSITLDMNKCENATIGHLEILSFKYSVETAMGANVSLVIGEVEEQLLESIAPFVLSCRNASNKNSGIIAVDAVPTDAPSTTETCSPMINSVHTCTVVDAGFSLFLSSEDDSSSALSLVLKMIENAMKSKTLTKKVETGLLNITFIPTNGGEEETSAVSGNTPAGANDSSLSAAGTSSVVLGGAIVLALLGAVYYVRHGRKGDAENSAIQETASSFANPSPRDDDRPTSPFSEMLPGAYRIGDLDKMSILSNSNMSPVYEDEDASQSVVVSESGYTTEAAGTDIGDDSSLRQRALYNTPDDDSNYHLDSNALEYLGARPRDGAHVVSDLEMSESELDSNSDISSQASPRKLYSTSLLPAGNEDESMHAEEDLLFENDRIVPGIATENSMVDVSLGP